MRTIQYKLYSHKSTLNGKDVEYTQYDSVAEAIDLLGHEKTLNLINRQAKTDTTNKERERLWKRVL